MNEDELRRRVSKRRKIPEQAWAFFLERGYVEDALMKDDDEEKVRFIVEEFDRHKAAFAGTRGRRQTPDQESSEVPVPLGDSELERKGASEEYAALRAARNGGTRWFREEVLRNRLLTAEQARELIRSPAARFLEASSFEFAGGDIPLIGHRANLEYCLPVRDGGKDVGHRARVSVDPPGITETVDNMFDEAPQP